MTRPYYGRWTPGHPVEAVEEITEWLNSDMRRVAETHLDDGNVFISTVFLTINHGFIEGEDEWFETMVFDECHREFDQDCWRYATEMEARAGHEAVCATIRHALEAERAEP